MHATCISQIFVTAVRNKQGKIEILYFIVGNIGSNYICLTCTISCIIKCWLILYWQHKIFLKSYSTDETVYHYTYAYHQEYLMKRAKLPMLYTCSTVYHTLIKHSSDVISIVQPLHVMFQPVLYHHSWVQYVMLY